MRVLSFIFLICLLFSTTVSAQTESSQTFFKQGTRAAESRDYKKALEFYKRALLFSEAGDSSRLKPFLARLHYNLGVCYYQLDFQNEAVKEFTFAINLGDKSYQRAFYGLGMAEAELKNWEPAKTAFLKSLRINERDGEVWFDLGMVLVKTRDYESARNAFVQAVKYNSISKSAGYNNMGVISALKGDFGTAEKEFKLALLESDGKLMVAENNLRFCRLHAGQQDVNLLSKLELSVKSNKLVGQN